MRPDKISSDQLAQVPGMACGADKNKMVVSSLLGGLGNQMFQYAAGRALSFERQSDFYLDVNGFEGYTLHQGFELPRVFMLEAELLDSKQVRSIFGLRTHPFIKRVLRRKHFSVLRGRHLAVEPHFNYWQGLKRVSSPTYMMGYWQSARYFEHCESVIRSDFCFRKELTGQSAEIAAAISAGQSISLHVRRGDYLTDGLMKVCSLDYYRRAIELIQSRVENPVFYVFSDDIAWAKSNFEFLHDAAFVAHNKGTDSYIDMQLMSLCKHQIIANSSFSWWGAWLNQKPEKIVIAPKDWFQADISDQDLIPPQWIRL